MVELLFEKLYLILEAIDFIIFHGEFLLDLITIEAHFLYLALKLAGAAIADIALGSVSLTLFDLLL